MSNSEMTETTTKKWTEEKHHFITDIVIITDETKREKLNINLDEMKEL